MGMWTGYANGLKIRNERLDDEQRRRQEQSNRDREFARQRAIDAQNQANREREFANQDRDFAAKEEEREFNRRYKEDEARREQVNSDRMFGLSIEKAQADIDAQNRRLDIEENNSVWQNAIHEENLRKARMLNDEQQMLFQQRQAKRDADWQNGVDRYANFAMLALNAQMKGSVPGKGWEGYEARTVDPGLVKRLADEYGVDIKNVTLLQKPGDPSTRSMYLIDSQGRQDIRSAQQIEQDLYSTFGDEEEASRLVYGMGQKERDVKKKLEIDHHFDMEKNRASAIERAKTSVFNKVAQMMAKDDLKEEDADRILNTMLSSIDKHFGVDRKVVLSEEDKMRLAIDEYNKIHNTSDSVVNSGGSYYAKNKRTGEWQQMTEENYRDLLGVKDDEGQEDVSDGASVEYSTGMSRISSKKSDAVKKSDSVRRSDTVDKRDPGHTVSELKRSLVEREKNDLDETEALRNIDLEGDVDAKVDDDLEGSVDLEYTESERKRDYDDFKNIDLEGDVDLEVREGDPFEIYDTKVIQEFMKTKKNDKHFSWKRLKQGKYNKLLERIKIKLERNAEQDRKVKSTEKQSDDKKQKSNVKTEDKEGLVRSNDNPRVVGRLPYSENQKSHLVR